VFHWNSLLERKRKVAQYKPQHNISCAAFYALRHGRRQREPSLEQSVTEPARSAGRLLVTASATPEGDWGGGRGVTALYFSRL